MEAIVEARFVVRSHVHRALLTSAGRIDGNGDWQRVCAAAVGANVSGLYAFIGDGRILYVGESSDVLARVRGEGPKLHEWRREWASREIDVLVFACLTPPVDVIEIGRTENESNPAEVVRRAVEAEVIFQFRAATGQLPLAQHEIHFQPRLYRCRYVRSCTRQILGRLLDACSDTD